MIKPLPGYVLVEPIEDDGQSAGGIYLPENTKDKPSKGTIIEIGTLPAKGDINLRNEIESAKVVIYKKWTNQEVTDEGKQYLLVKFDELLGVII